MSKALNLADLLEKSTTVVNPHYVAAELRRQHAEIERLEQRDQDLYEDVQRFKEHALNEKDARMALEREI